MRIILEGPDNGGKTTLARKIIDLCPMIQYKHPGGPPKDVVTEQQCVDQQCNWLTEEHVLIDRVTTISQRVYNPDPILDDVRKTAFTIMYASLEPVLIYCRPPTDWLLRADKFTWREGESEEHKQKIITNQHTFVSRYDNIMERTPHIVYDFNDESAAKALIQGLKSSYDGDANAARWLRDLVNFGRY